MEGRHKEDKTGTDLPPATLTLIQTTQDMIQTDPITRSHQNTEGIIEAKIIIEKDHRGRENTM